MFILEKRKNILCLWKLSEKEHCAVIETITTVVSKGRFPFRKISIGSDRTGLFYLVLSALPDQKKLKILQLFIIRVADHMFKLGQKSTEQKSVPKAHARVQFCSDPVRSHAYFPEWKPILKEIKKTLMFQAKVFRVEDHIAFEVNTV